MLSLGIYSTMISLRLIFVHIFQYSLTLELFLKFEHDDDCSFPLFDSSDMISVIRYFSTVFSKVRVLVCYSLHSRRIFSA